MKLHHPTSADRDMKLLNSNDSTERSTLVPFMALVLLAVIILGFSSVKGFANETRTAVLYRLGSGDQLRLIVFGHEDLSGEFEVDESGSVSLPLVGAVAVGGQSVSEAENAIVEALKPDYLKNPRVNLQILNYRPFYIIGEVNAPGSYPYVNGMTVINAVAIAGGFTYRARETRVELTRGNDPDSEKIEAAPDTVILPGDVIEVPERFF